MSEADDRRASEYRKSSARGLVKSSVGNYPEVPEGWTSASKHSGFRCTQPSCSLSGPKSRQDAAPVVGLQRQNRQNLPGDAAHVVLLQVIWNPI